MRRRGLASTVRFILVAAFGGAAIFFVCALLVLAVKGNPKVRSTGYVSPWKCIISSNKYVWDFKPRCRENFMRAGRAAEVRFNSMGLRDRDYSSRPKYKNRILFIGDSGAVGAGLAERFTVPRLLEASWRKKGFSVEVINGGKSGYTAVQQYLNLPELLDAYRPTRLVMVGGVGYGYLARLHYLEPFVQRDEMGRPKFVAPLNYEGRWWSFLARNWGETESDRFLLLRQFQMQAGLFAQSWGCVFKGVGGDAAGCMMQIQLRDLVNIWKLSESRGVSFVVAFDEVNEMMRGFEGEGIIMSPPLPMPFAHRVLRKLTPTVSFTYDSVKRLFSQVGLPYVQFSMPSFSKNPDLYFPGVDVHLNEKGSRLLAGKIEANLGDAILIK